MGEFTVACWNSGAKSKKYDDDGLTFSFRDCLFFFFLAWAGTVFGIRLIIYVISDHTLAACVRLWFTNTDIVL